MLWRTGWIDAGFGTLEPPSRSASSFSLHWLAEPAREVCSRKPTCSTGGHTSRRNSSQKLEHSSGRTFQKTHECFAISSPTAPPFPFTHSACCFLTSSIRTIGSELFLILPPPPVESFGWVRRARRSCSRMCRRQTASSLKLRAQIFAFGLLLPTGNSFSLEICHPNFGGLSCSRNISLRTSQLEFIARRHHDRSHSSREVG